MITAALYKGPASNWYRQLAHALICWRTDGPYSHIEFIDREGYGWSSSYLDGGVRRKAIDFNNGHWDLKYFEGDHDQALAWFVAHKGQPYGWLTMILAFILPWRVSFGGSGFCSKAFAEAMGWAGAWKLSPNDIAKKADKERAVP